jgi:hypothetical protein
MKCETGWAPNVPTCRFLFALPYLTTRACLILISKPKLADINQLAQGRLQIPA